MPLPGVLHLRHRAAVRVLGRLQVTGVDVAAVELLAELLLVVERAPDVRLVGLRVLVLRGADERRRVHRVRRRRTLLDDLGADHREVGDAGRGARLVRAVLHVVDLVEEDRRRTDEREVLRAGLDDRVARLVLAQLRVDEVDRDLAAREAAVRVDVLRPALHPVDRALEDARSERGVDVGDDRDPDRRRRDPDLGCVRLGARGGGDCGRPGQGAGDRQDDRHPACVLHRVPPSL